MRGLVFFAVISIGCLLPVQAKTHSSHRRHSPEKKSDSSARNKTIEAATRLQVFLDRANFSPGRLDGHYGDFTLKALALYRQSRGEQPPQSAKKSDSAPDVNGIDLASVGPVFVPYTVTDADMQTVGPLPTGIPEQAKLKTLPYREVVEANAEKFHSETHFLDQLNHGKLKTAKAGDQLMVPNVEPFELAEVKAIKPGSEVAAQPAANEMPDEPEPQSPAPGGGKTEEEASPGPQPAPSGPVSVKVDTKTNMLGVFEGDKIISCYPVTIGSAQTQSPIGEWKIRAIAKMPNFRYDEQMLNRGERSKNFHMLPPGPNNPVGVMWIALNKKGIGLHGTAEPDSIGRGVSHGCVRLANWDIVRLATKVKPGVAVSIH